MTTFVCIQGSDLRLDLLQQYGSTVVLDHCATEESTIKAIARVMVLAELDSKLVLSSDLHLNLLSTAIWCSIRPNAEFMIFNKKIQRYVPFVVNRMLIQLKIEHISEDLLTQRRSREPR